MDSTSINKAQAFHMLHHAPAPLILINAWDAASAALFVRAGARAIATTSAGMAWSSGYADGERLPFGELLRGVHNICRVVRVPVSVDIEGGFGLSARDVVRNVDELIDAGAIGVNIEDGRDDARQSLGSAERTAERIAAIRERADARGLPFFINARSDGFALSSRLPARRFVDTFTRLQLYARAGADGLFVPGLRDLEQIARLTAQLSLPLNVYAGSPGAPTIAQLTAAGVRRISVGCGPLQAMLSQAQAMAHELLRDGRYDRILDKALTIADLNSLFH